MRFEIINKIEVNQRFQEIVKRDASFAATPQLNTIFKRRFFSLKNQMIAEFLNLDITQEIMAGPNAPNISGTLNGYGNLFSYIGFENGTDPIEPILTLLYQTDMIYIRTTPNFVQFTITFPSAKEIFAITPLPWAEGRSWAQGIEQGLSGLGWYVYKPSGAGPSSRSGTAVQTQFGPESKKRPGLIGWRRLNSNKSVNTKFRNTSYISEFVNKWEKRFSELQ